MIIRIATILLCFIFHLFTPSWFKSDIVELSDWVMFFFVFISAIVFYFYSEKKPIKKISLWISINAVAYYLATIHGCTFESLDSDCSSYRLSAIFNTTCHLSEKMTQGFEMINFIQVVANGILFLILMYFVVSKKKNISN